MAHWTELGAPYEAGCARLVLGQAHAQDGSQARARQQWSAAQSSFTSFGAVVRAEQAAALMGAASTASGGRSGSASRATFRRIGDNRLVCFGGVDTLLADLKGFRYLERMLADPGREFHVLDLVAVAHGTAAVAAVGGLPVIDDQARDAYRRRLAEVDEDIDDAISMNDPGRRALAERDRDFLVAELAGAVGLGGRHRLTDSSAERARTSVTRTLRYAVQRLAEHHSDLGVHLERAVKTGIYCGYHPDPLSPVTWDL